MATLTARSKATGRPDAAGALWLVQAISGLALIVVLGIHMVAHHFVVEGGLRNFQQVVAYVSNPFIFALEVLFLIIVTSHALLGVRAVLFDRGLSLQAQRVVNGLLLLVGVGVIAYGIWLANAIQQL